MLDSIGRIAIMTLELGVAGSAVNRYELKVGQADQGSSLMQVLRRAHPAVPDWVLRRALQSRDIRLNGERVRENCSLKAGDQLLWYTAWSAPEVPVLHEDAQLLVLHKPAGMNSDAQQDGQSVIAWALEHSAGAYRPRLVHRLDNQTAGVMVLAKTDEAEAELLAAFRERRMQKRYTCLVLGCPEPQEAQLIAYMMKPPGGGKVLVFNRPRPGSREMLTSYQVIETEAGVSRLLVQPLTGRTHQIRAHLAHLGHPLLGDDKYGDREANRRLKQCRLMLAATGLGFGTQGALAYMNGRTFEVDAGF